MPTHSVLGHPCASRRSSVPRVPIPITPTRTRSLAPSTLDAASVPANPVATLPMKFRLDCTENTPFLGVENEYLYSLAEAGRGAGRTLATGVPRSILRRSLQGGGLLDGHGHLGQNSQLDVEGADFGADGGQLPREPET